MSAPASGAVLVTPVNVMTTSSGFSRTVSFPITVGSIDTTAERSPAAIVTVPVVVAKSSPSMAPPSSGTEISNVTIVGVELGRSRETMNSPATVPSIPLDPDATVTV